MTIDQLPTLTDPTGDVYFPVNKNGADYKLPTGGVLHIAGLIPAGETASFTVGNSTRFVLFTSGAASTMKGAWIFNSNASGSLSNAAVLSASNVTISTSTNSLDLSFSAVGSYLILVFAGSVTLQ